MKVHTTNYYNTFIEIAGDCPAKRGELPPENGEQKSIANRQFELIYENPYKFTSDDVLFMVYAERNEIPENELAEARAAFFSKGQPCFRSSPLTKRYGWGIHSNHEGKIALIGCETPEYKNFIENIEWRKVKAMRSSKQ